MESLLTCVCVDVLFVNRMNSNCKKTKRVSVWKTLESVETGGAVEQFVAHQYGYKTILETLICILDFKGFSTFYNLKISL